MQCGDVLAEWSSPPMVISGRPPKEEKRLFFSSHSKFRPFLLQKPKKIKRPQSTKDSPTLGVKLISIRRCPPCRLPLRVTFLILLRTESTLLSSALLFHEAAARTSEEIQAWMQQNSMNFLCRDCIVGFLRLFCHIFYWYLWPWASASSPTTQARLPRVRGDKTPASHPMNLPAMLSRNHVRRSRLVTPPFANAGRNLLCPTRWRWWNPSLRSERAALLHAIHMTDSYNRPDSEKRDVLTETRVAAMVP